MYDASIMAKMDIEKERQRLAKLYAEMEPRELEEIGSEPESLTDIAREALWSEMTRRGLRLPAQKLTSPGDPNAPAPVIIARYRDLGDAMVAKSILDSAGIESFLADDNVVRLDWLYSNLVGGIKLLVRAENAEAARNLLNQNVPERFEVEGVGEYEQPKCPVCRSVDVGFDELDKRIAYTGFLLALPIPITSKEWACHSCGHKWKDEAEK